MANVTLKEVYKYYEKNPTPAVADFNLDINDKEFVVFVGPSGCGKSTTLRMIAGLEEISYGQVAIDGRIVNNVEPKDRNIAMVFQNYALYPHMSVYDNMAFGLKMARTPREKRDESFIAQKNGRKIGFFGRLFGRVPQELRDEHGEIVKNTHGETLYATLKKKDGTDKLDKNGVPIIAKRRYTDEEKYGRIIRDEHGNPVLIPKVYSRDCTTRESQKDELGYEILDEHGRPKTIHVEHKKGDVVRDSNNEIVYKKRKYTREEIRNKVMEAAEILDITQYLDRKPKAMSGGQRQRVAIGRAIVRKPKVFLMDEPLSNLDAKLRNSMRSEILLLRKRINTTFVYVTHDQTEAMTLGDRIVIMRDGFIQQVGTPAEVFDTPENLFVAGFIGSPQMNFFDAKLVKNADNYAVAINSSIIPLNKQICAKLAANGVAERDIVLGVRPEHISVLKSGEKAKAETTYLDAKVSVSEMMGSELYVHCEVEGVQIIVRIPTIELAKEDRDNIHNGGTLKIAFRSEVIHLFDKETEISLLK